MTGIFRSAFRPPQPVQSPLAALSVAGQGGAAIQPAHLTNANAFFAPSLRFVVGAAWFQGAQGFAAPALRLTLKPAALGSGGALYAPEVTSDAAAIQPAAFANGQGFFAQSLRLTVKPAAVANTPAFFGLAVKRGVQPATYANAPSFFGPRLTLRISAAAYANAQAFGAALVAQPGVKVAPHTPSVAQIFGPSLAGSFAVEAIGGIGAGAGWIGDQAPRRARRKAVTWPNLPRVSEAPPWNPLVVTAEAARHRARVTMAWRKRIEQQRRKRDVDRRVGAIFDRLIEDEIARTISALSGEAR